MTASRVPDGSDPDAFDVAVVGGGPAGSTVAGLLARQGHNVLIVDRATFPRPKPCGECVNPGAVAALRRLGLLDDVRALAPARLLGWTIRAGSSEASGSFGSGTTGLGIGRSELDHALLKAAGRRGARLWQDTRVEHVEVAVGGGRPTLRLRTAAGLRTLRPRVVVGADGLRSRVARSIGAVAPPGPLRKVSLTCRVRWTGRSGAPAEGGLLDVRDGVTLGIAPVSADRSLWNATVVGESARYRYEADRFGDPAAWVASLMDERLGECRGREIIGGPWASGRFDRPVARPWAPGVVLVGDAAGYYDPFTGQGVYRALRSAELAADAVAEVLDRADGGSRRERDPWTPLRRYGRRWKANNRGARFVQRVIEAAVSRPAVTSWILPRFERAGSLDGLIRVTGDTVSIFSLAAPTWWIPPLLARPARPFSPDPPTA